MMALTAKLLWRRARIPLFFAAILWLVKVYETVFDLNLTHFGVYPRSWSGFWGILTYPLIHGDWSHLYNNTMPLLVLGTALFYFFPICALRITGIIYFVSGIWIWLVGSTAWHIGASGLVYGLAFFHFWNGIFSNDRNLMAISLIVVFLYGSMIWGVFPIKPETSWEGHLGGALTGVALAYYYRKRNEKGAETEELAEVEEFSQFSQTGSQEFVYRYSEKE